MKYNTSRDFRQALETRIRNISLETEMPLVRLRKLVVFERFLIRLVHIQPDKWVLKGGYALQLRLGDRARTTKDIDLLSIEQKKENQLSKPPAFLTLEIGFPLRWHQQPKLLLRDLLFCGLVSALF